MVSLVHYSRACFTVAAITLLIVVIVLPSTNAVSLITFDSANSNACSCPTLSWLHTTGSGPNRILIVGVSDTGAPPSYLVVSGVTYGGSPLTLIAAQEGLPFERAEMWYLSNPPTGTATVTVTVVGFPDGIVGGSVSYSNVGSLGSHSSNSGINSNPSASVSANAGDLVVDTVAVGPLHADLTPGSGQTQRWIGGGTGAGSDKPASSPVTMTWSSATPAEEWALVAVDLQPFIAPIPEYPLGLSLLAIFMVISYGLIRRRTSTKDS